MPMRAWLCLSLLLSACHPLPLTPAETSAPPASPSSSPSASPLPSPSPSPLPTPAPSLSPNAVRVSAVSVSPTLEISLTFSAGVTPESVREGFSIHVLKDQKLSWQTNDKPLYETLRGEPVSNSADIATRPVLLTAADFNWSWNGDQTEFTLTPKLNVGGVFLGLPTDQDLAKAPTYALSFCAQAKKQPIQTLSGDSLSGLWFQNATGPVDYHAFQVQASERTPAILYAGPFENRIQIGFSTPISIATPWGQASSANTSLYTAKGILAPSNYYVRLFSGTGTQKRQLAAFTWDAIDRDGRGAVIASQSGQVQLVAEASGASSVRNMYRVDLIPPLDLTSMFEQATSIEIRFVDAFPDALGDLLKQGDGGEFPILRATPDLN